MTLSGDGGLLLAASRRGAGLTERAALLTALAVVGPQPPVAAVGASRARCLPGRQWLLDKAVMLPYGAGGAQSLLSVVMPCWHKQIPWGAVACEGQQTHVLHQAYAVGGQTAC